MPNTRFRGSASRVFSCLHQAPDSCRDNAAGHSPTTVGITPEAEVASWTTTSSSLFCRSFFANFANGHPCCRIPCAHGLSGWQKPDVGASSKNALQFRRGQVCPKYLAKAQVATEIARFASLRVDRSTRPTPSWGVLPDRHLQGSRECGDGDRCWPLSVPSMTGRQRQTARVRAVTYESAFTAQAAAKQRRRRCCSPPQLK